MSKKHRSFIRILNPSGSPYTSLKRANWYVSSGHAVWEGNCIRLKAKYLAASKESAMWHRIKHRLRTMDEAGYDGVGQMRVDQIQGLPVAGPAEKMVQKGSKYFTARALPRGKVKTISV